MDNLDERLQSLLEEHKQFGCDRPVSFRIANGDNNVFCLCSVSIWCLLLAKQKLNAFLLKK